MPRLSRMKPGICVWMAYTPFTDKPFDLLAWEQVSVDVSEKLCSDKTGSGKKKTQKKKQPHKKTKKRRSAMDFSPACKLFPGLMFDLSS